jgi:hypothetical protein
MVYGSVQMKLVGHTHVLKDLAGRMPTAGRNGMIFLMAIVGCSSKF